MRDIQDKKYGLVGKAGKKFLVTTALTAASLVAISSPGHAIDPNATPQGENVVAGDVQSSLSGNTYTTKQNSQNAIVDYTGGINLGSNMTWHIDQANKNYRFVGRDQNPWQNASFIDGFLKAKGQVFLLNRNGVIFGNNSRIDVGSIVASTAGQINEDAFMNGGAIELSDFGNAEVAIDAGATMTVAQGGLAALVGPNVRNSGVINAKLGTVAFAAGEKVTIDLYGDGLFEVAVDGEVEEAIIEHTGTINAEGGNVLMTARTAKEAVDSVINMAGVVNASSVDTKGGKIVLSGGENTNVNVSGKADVSGATGGGDIDIDGKGVIIEENAELVADANENGNGGNIRILGQKYAILAGRASARGGALGGNGGFVELSAFDAVGLAGSSFVDTRAPLGETGTFLIDPETINLGNFAWWDVGNLTNLKVDGQALANILGASNVNLWATDRIYTSSDLDLSTWQFLIRSGTTSNDLTLAAPTIDILHDIKLGTGSLYLADILKTESVFGFGLVNPSEDILVETVNLEGNIYDHTDALAGAAQLHGTAHEVNVVEGSSINQAIQFADGSLVGGATVNVGDGTWQEAVVVDRALNLIGDGPTNTTTIEVASNSTGITVNSSNVNIDGFRFERDGNASNAVGIRLDGRFATNGTISDIKIGDTALDVDAIGNYFVDGLSIGVQALGDVDNVEVSNNTFGMGAGDDRITKGIVSRVERSGSGSSVIDGNGNVLGQNDIAPHNDWTITNNDFTIKTGSKSATMDLEGISGTAPDSFEISENTLNGAAKVGIHIPAVGGNGSGAPYPLTTNILVHDNTINDLGKGGTGIRVGANFDSVSPGNDRFRLSGVNITDNTINGTKTAIDVTGVTFATMEDVVVDGNIVNGATETGIRLNIVGRTNAGDPDWTGFVVSNNDVTMDTDGTGLNVNYSQNAALEIGAGNIFTGGTDGIVINGKDGKTLTLIGNTINDTVFSGQTGDYIRLEDTALFSPGDFTTVDASGVTFDGVLGSAASVGDSFDIENKIVHQMDDEDVGLIEWIAGNLFVTTSTLGIQHAVDISDVGNDIYVDDGKYNEAVNVWKTVQLFGNNFGTSALDPRDPESIVTGNSPAWTVNADNVIIDGFTMDGPFLTYGVLLNDVKGTEITNNVISRSSIAGIGGVVDHDDAVQVDLLISGNKIDDSNTGDGINISGDGAGVAANAGSIVGSRIDILNNEIGTDSDVYGDSVNDGVGEKGIVFSKIGDPNNLADAQYGWDVVTASEINITGNDVFSQDEALDFSGDIDEATITISGNNDGFVTLGSNKNGIDFDGLITNTFITIANNILDVTGDAIDFGQNISGSTINIKGNDITADSSGLDIDGVRSGSIINIGGAGANEDNIIDAGDRGIDFDSGIDGANTVVSIQNNQISAGQDGVAIWDNADSSAVNNGATVNITDNRIGYETGDTIGDDGLLFADHITGGSTVNITGNKIGKSADGVNDDGVDFDKQIKGGSTVTIANNTIYADSDGANIGAIKGANTLVTIGSSNTIVGGSEGLDIQSVNNGTLKIDDNTLIEGKNGDGIQVDNAITNTATVEITENDEIKGGDNGIELASVNNSSVTISGNNAGIFADVHGIAVLGAVSGSADIDIHDNIIQANLDTGDGLLGNGIYFESTVTDSFVNIGDGSLPGSSDRSNIISGYDGVHFADTVKGTTEIVIDGNRLGYRANTINQPSLTNYRLSGDGIQFAAISDDANVQITENAVRASSNGVNVTGSVDDNTVVTIGGTLDNQNWFDSNGNGVAFQNTVTGNSTIEISYNDIDADLDGILFGGPVNNYSSPVSQNEILIAYNDIDIYSFSGGNGIHFASTVSDNRHDTRIEGNNIFVRNGGNHGIYFEGAVDDASIWIVGSNSVYGDEDGINFGGEIKNNARIRIHGNDLIDGEDQDGIDFDSDITSGSYVSINNNHEINADDNGIEFSSVNNATVDIIGNNDGIDAGDHGIYFGGAVTGQTLVSITDNIIEADDDGIRFAGPVNNAITSGVNQQEIYIANNDIDADDNGINFEGLVSGFAHDQLITGNTIIADDDGIVYQGDIDAAHVRIMNGNDINADRDAIAVRDDLQNGSKLSVINNTNLIAQDGDGIEIGDDVKGGSTLSILNNHNIDAGDNGIEIGDQINNSTVLISGNNAGIQADDHGIYFGGNVLNGSDIDIHDNIIKANLDNGYTGAGIWFNGSITGSTIDIGDGSYTTDPSNFITVNNPFFGQLFGSLSDLDGIRFNGQIGNGANVDIDGNRIGYNGTPGNHGSAVQNRIADDGIDFAGIGGNANVTVRDNHIATNDEGVQFNGLIDGTADILIGGSGDRNIINALWGNGIAFFKEITGNALVEINNNDIDSWLGNGILFDGPTNNFRTWGPSSGQEIFITKNDIEGSNGIIFNDLASYWRHDIKIEDNDLIDGRWGVGIGHYGGIEGAELKILENDDIDAWEDAIRVRGQFWNNARIKIIGNDNIDSSFDDGIDLRDLTAGGTTTIVRGNHIHYTYEDGIFGENMDGILIDGNNVIHDTGLNAIKLINSDGFTITGNDIDNSGEDGIDIEDTAGGSITLNNIDGSNDDGYAGGRGIEITDSTSILVDDNDVLNTQFGGAGIYVDPSSFITVSNNTISGNAIGVWFDEVTDSSITSNIIENGVTGILIEESDVIDISGNTVQNNLEYGLFVQGDGNGDIAVSDNDFIDNPVHALFESGLIDLTGIGNLFQNGETALIFSPFGSDQSLLRLVDNDGPGSTPFGSAFPPTNFAGTLGNQTFDGQTEKFVTLQNNAFFVGGSPLWLNALDSTYFIPGSAGGPNANSFFTPPANGVLDIDTFNFLESMFDHFPDFGNVGVFFFGFVPGIAEEDVYQYFTPPNLNTTNLSLTILGFPSTGVGGGTAPFAISPFAGGEEGGAPAVNPEALNEIETAAGESDPATCWGDALNMASAGQVVNYSYGTSFEDTIAGAAGCASTF